MANYFLYKYCKFTITSRVHTSLVYTVHLHKRCKNITALNMIGISYDDILGDNSMEAGRTRHKGTLYKPSKLGIKSIEKKV